MRSALRTVAGSNVAVGRRERGGRGSAGPFARRATPGLLPERDRPARRDGEHRTCRVALNVVRRLGEDVRWVEERDPRGAAKDLRVGLAGARPTLRFPTPVQKAWFTTTTKEEHRDGQ